MSTIPEIEIAIAKLPVQQFHELARWIDERRADMWDRQIEEDATNGNLDRLYALLEKENKGQPEVPLDDFLDQIEFSKKI